METAKPWYQSKACIGILTALLGWLLTKVHVNLGLETLTNYVTDFLQIAGLAFAFVGRLTADTSLTLTKAKAIAENANTPAPSK